jgi:predicted ATPase
MNGFILTAESMLSRVKIKGYKSFQDVDVRLKPVTILIGPNASGKSNFLDALHFLHLAVTQTSLSAAFQSHRGYPLECLYRGDDKGGGIFSIQAWVELSPSVVHDVEEDIRKFGKETSQRKRYIYHKRLCYELSIEIDSIGGARVRSENLFAVRKGGEGKSRRPFLETTLDGKIRLRMEGQAHPRYFEVGRDRTVLGYEDLYKPHYPHLVAFKEELSRWAFFYLEPRSLMRREEPRRETLRIGSEGENLASFLNTLKGREEHKPAFRAIEKNLHLLVPSITRLDVRVDDEGFLHLILYENGRRISSRTVSEGTLRLLGILSIVTGIRPNTLIGYEEPENGVHPQRLKDIAEIFEKSAVSADGKVLRQVILTTHSPRLPLHFNYQPGSGFCEILVFQKKEGKTSILPFNEFKEAHPLFRESSLEDALKEMERVGLD